MARLKALKDYINGEKFYLEPLTGMSFQRISAGMAWPFKEKPGCCIVLGETRGIDNLHGQVRCNVHKLLEKQSADVSELVDLVLSMTEDWYIPFWATPLSDKRVFLLEDLNDELRRKRRVCIAYGDPQGFSGKGEGLLPFYHSLVQRRTVSEKTLFLGDGEGADEIAVMRYDDKEKSILDYPSAAAICFALAEIDCNPKVGKFDSSPFGPADGLGGY